MKISESKEGRISNEEARDRKVGSLLPADQIRLRKNIGFRNPSIMPPEEITDEHKRRTFVKYLVDTEQINADDDAAFPFMTTKTAEKYAVKLLESPPAEIIFSAEQLEHLRSLRVRKELPSKPPPTI